VTIAVCPVLKDRPAVAARTACPADQANPATPACPANPHQFACRPLRQRANHAHLARPVHLDSLAIKVPAASLATRDHLAKMLNLEDPDRRDRPARLVNPDLSDHPVMLVNQQKARPPAPESLDLQEHPVHLARPAPMAALAPTDSPAALVPKDHQAPVEPPETQEQVDSPVAKDRLANKESLVFAPNIVPWTVVSFSPTAFADKLIEKLQKRKHSDVSSLPKYQQRVALTCVLFPHILYFTSSGVYY
jgi:hypothetical protein